jgi:hypothetical protein
MQRLIERVSNDSNKLNKIIISNGNNSKSPQKIVIRRISFTKSSAQFQVEEFSEKKVFHKNFSAQELILYLTETINNECYKQYNVFFID